MRRIVAVTLQILIIIAISVGLLELVLRVAAPHLPGQIGVVARYVTTGQPFSEAWTPAWRENRDHFYALRPGIENACSTAARPCRSGSRPISCGTTDCRPMKASAPYRAAILRRMLWSSAT
ncbi:MAG: hypothetical protein UZ13_02595, partial [Chloroflexi bacterium OLB13]